MSRQKATITCAHCGQMFQIEHDSGSGATGDRGMQHSPGCMKMTRVKLNQGRIVGTTKG